MALSFSTCFFLNPAEHLGLFKRYVCLSLDQNTACIDVMLDQYIHPKHLDEINNIEKRINFKISNSKDFANNWLQESFDQVCWQWRSCPGKSKLPLVISGRLWISYWIKNLLGYTNPWHYNQLQRRESRSASILSCCYWIPHHIIIQWTWKCTAWNT